MKKQAGIACVLVTLILVFTLPTAIFASAPEHVHTEKCITCCELDVIDIEEPYIPENEHHDHPNSECCKYSCNYELECHETVYPWNTETEKQFFEELAAVNNTEEKNIVFSKYLGIPVETLEEILSNHETQPKGGCVHLYFTAACKGDHYGQNGCTVWCRRMVVCYYCNEPAQVVISEESHDWSVGWCGQTCKRCGIIELFHAPGGCWYCS